MSVNLGNDTKATSPVRTPDEAKESKYESKQNKKIVRLLTVIAYVISVSMAAIILSLYYVFLWDPQSKYPGPPIDTSPFSVPGTSDTPPVADNMMDSQATPKALPIMSETYNTAQQSQQQQQQHTGQASTQSISNNNHQSPGPSPQQGITRDTSPTGTSYVTDEIRQQQQHGQPPLTASA